MFINILQYARGEQIMYRAIVVDDESIIRNGISSFINSCDAGFEVVGTFPDGKDAIDFLHDNEVELIITDIKREYRKFLMKLKNWQLLANMENLL